MAELCQFPVEVDDDGPCQTCGHGGRVHPDEGDWDEVTPPEERPSAAFCIFCEEERESVEDRRQFHPYQPPVVRVCGHPESDHIPTDRGKVGCVACYYDHPVARLMDMADVHAFDSGVEARA